LIYLFVKNLSIIL